MEGDGERVDAIEGQVEEHEFENDVIQGGDEEEGQ